MRWSDTPESLLQCLWENAHQKIEEALTKLDDNVGILALLRYCLTASQ